MKEFITSPLHVLSYNFINSIISKSVTLAISSSTHSLNRLHLSCHTIKHTIFLQFIVTFSLKYRRRNNTFFEMNWLIKWSLTTFLEKHFLPGSDFIVVTLDTADAFAKNLNKLNDELDKIIPQLYWTLTILPLINGKFIEWVKD